MDNQPRVTANNANSSAEQEGGKKTASRSLKQPQELPEDYAQWLDERVFAEEEAEV